MPTQDNPGSPKEEWIGGKSSPDVIGALTEEPPQNPKSTMQPAYPMHIPLAHAFLILNGHSCCYHSCCPAQTDIKFCYPVLLQILAISSKSI